MTHVQEHSLQKKVQFKFNYRKSNQRPELWPSQHSQLRVWLRKHVRFSSQINHIVWLEEIVVLHFSFKGEFIWLHKRFCGEIPHYSRNKCDNIWHFYTLQRKLLIFFWNMKMKTRLQKYFYCASLIPYFWLVRTSSGKRSHGTVFNTSMYGLPRMLSTCSLMGTI